MGGKASKSALPMMGELDMVERYRMESRTGSFTTSRVPGDLQNYILGRKLGAGRFGEVYQATDKRNNQEVAIKFLKRGSTLNSSYVAREVLNHQELSHPHIVEFREAGWHPYAMGNPQVFLTHTHLCIAMDYAEGGNLKDYLGENDIIGEEHARWLFQQLVLGVDYCHRMNTVIRDIKLSNILLNKTHDHLQICDFGFSKNAKRDSPSMTFLGTDAYMPPELLLRAIRGETTTKSFYNAQKVDMWTCGVTLYTMLVGCNPFYNPSDSIASRAKMAIARMMMFKKNMKKSTNLKRLPQDLSEECQDFLVAILDPNPESRMSLEEAKTHPWFTKNLPPDFYTYNDMLLREHRAAESWKEDKIRELVHQARLALKDLRDAQPST